MNMEFCKCGSIMHPTKNGLKCKKCGNEIIKQINWKIKTKTKKENIVVIENNDPDLPKTDKECPKCSRREAWYWLIQTRSADEPPTQFFKCTKCRHIWREYK